MYVQARSKKQVNELLAAGEWVQATEYKLGHSSSQALHTVPEGTLVKVYEKMVNGTPVAKAYGQMRDGRLR